MLLQEGELLQSRPGIIPIGILFSIPVSIVTNLTNLAPFTYYDSLLIDTNIFLGFILFNFTLLFLSLLLFLKISDYLKLNRLLKVIGLLLISLTPITKTFLLTPHLQLLNLFVPVFSLFIIVRGLNTKWSLKSLYLLSIVTSFFTLLYPSFILTLVSILLVYILQDNIKLFEINKIINPKRFLHIFLLSLVSVFPTVIWPVIVKQIAGFYFNHATETYRQFVWVIDGFSLGVMNGFSYLVRYFQSFINSMDSELVISILILILLGVLNKRFKNILFKLSPYFILILVFLIFFFLLGYYVDRLLFNITLIIQLVILFVVNEYIKLNKIFNLVSILLLILTILKIFILVIEYGPYS